MLFREEEEFFLFRDRTEAGQILGSKLSNSIARQGVEVLALPRGGVVVGFEVAKLLHVPLDVFVVRKLGAPGNPELAIGAIASGGVRILNVGTVQALQIPEHAIEAIVAQEEMELHRREQLYRRGLPGWSIAGRHVVLVDDGIATGATMRAAIAALRQLKVAHITVAVPVSPMSKYYELTKQAEDVVCVSVSDAFVAISQCYDSFEQVSDEQVISLLQRAAAPAMAA
jgi:predicted phosphoribosyltransferase